MLTPLSLSPSPLPRVGERQGLLNVGACVFRVVASASANVGAVGFSPNKPLLNHASLRIHRHLHTQPERISVKASVMQLIKFVDIKNSLLSVSSIGDPAKLTDPAPSSPDLIAASSLGYLCMLAEHTQHHYHSRYIVAYGYIMLILLAEIFNSCSIFTSCDFPTNQNCS